MLASHSSWRVLGVGRGKQAIWADGWWSGEPRKPGRQAAPACRAFIASKTMVQFIRYPGAARQKKKKKATLTHLTLGMAPRPHHPSIRREVPGIPASSSAKKRHLHLHVVQSLSWCLFCPFSLPGCWLSLSLSTLHYTHGPHTPNTPAPGDQRPLGS